MSLDVATQLLAGPFDVELGIVLHRLGELVVALDRRVVAKHVQDETLLDRLFHAVGVKGVVLDRAVVLRVRIAEDLQRLVLGRSRGGDCPLLRSALPRLFTGPQRKHTLQIKIFRRYCYRIFRRFETPFLNQRPWFRSEKTAPQNTIKFVIVPMESGLPMVSFVQRFPR